MSVWLLLQLAIYEVLDIVPCAILVVTPFRQDLRSLRKLVLALCVLYLLGIARRIIALYFPPLAVILAVLWITLYTIGYKITIRASLHKGLLVLIVVLNYANFVAILYLLVGKLLFGSNPFSYPYSLQASLALLLTFLATFAPMYYLMARKIAPLIAIKENTRIWSFLWLIPATFCVFFYYAYSGSMRSLAFAMISSIGSFFVLLLTLRLVQENRVVLELESRNHYLSVQMLQYNNLKTRIEETRRARHDLRQCLNVMQTYLRNEDLAALQGFVSQYCSTLRDNVTPVYCKNLALNSVVSYYADLAFQNQIAFDAKVSYPENSLIKETDLVVLFGNLLENAVEACARQTQTAGFIRLIVQIEGNAIVIAIDNSYEDSLAPHGGTFLSSKREGTGIGILSVQRIVEQYHGILTFQNDDCVFRVSILLHP